MAYDEDNFQRDHYVFYVGAGSTIRNAAQADLLIVGNSRIQSGLDPDEVAAFGAAHALRVYNMGFGWNESSILTEVVMDRHRLRPRWLLVNADVSSDGSFFYGGPSIFGAKVLREGPWAATRLIYGKMWGDAFRRQLERVFPHIVPGARRNVIYRSWSSGWWIRPPEAFAPGTILFSPPSHPPAAAELALEEDEARRFVERMRQRGTTVIFTSVPGPGSDQTRARALAAAVGVPFVSPTVEDLTPFDGSHLDVTSAGRFTRALLDGLSTLLSQ